MATINTVLTRLFLTFIFLYRYLISPFIGYGCRFEPSCSLYAMEAIKQYGWLIGSGYMLRRILRCHPGCKGGVDILP